MSLQQDLALRSAAFAFLDDLRLSRMATGGLLTRDDVAVFMFEGHRIPLRDAGRGIRYAAGTNGAISFTTSRKGPYTDQVGPDGFIRYSWQGTSPAGDNLRMRQAMQQRLPLIWFVEVGSSLYEPIYPVWVVDEEQALHQFVVALEQQEIVAWENKGLFVELGGRSYAERITKVRLHQPLFRQRVLLAYERRCAICRLKHVGLLDAAHIKSDSSGGEPVVHNGIAMCKIHHGAFDLNILGIRPDLRLVVRQDVLDEVDGPMLQHGLQAFHQALLTTPASKTDKPDRLLLEERYDEFLHAG